MKRYLLYLLTFGCCLLLLPSCTATKQVSNQDEAEKAYIGKDLNTIIMSLGPVVTKSSDGSDGYVCTFNEGKDTYYHCYFNSDDICYRVLTNSTTEKKRFKPLATIGLILAIIIATRRL